MAARLSVEQIAEIAAISSAPEVAGNPRELLRRLAAAKTSAFTPEALAAALGTFEKLDLPVAARPSWASSPGRGLFFVFEGLDRSGKSTQSRLLTKRLEELGRAVKWTCFPNRSTTIGTLIDLYLLRKIELSDEAVHLLFSANRWEFAESLVADLSQGVCIVCDRYAFSGVAYTAAKGLDIDWCQAPDRGLPVPDGIFFLHLDEKVGASRANYGDERYENATMQAAVRKEFQRPALRQGVAWHDVDAAREIETIRLEIATAVEALSVAPAEAAEPPRKKPAPEVQPGVPIRRLWVAGG